MKILNATKDQLIICKQVNYEVSPYVEYSIRQVKQQLNDIESLDVSGLNVYWNYGVLRYEISSWDYHLFKWFFYQDSTKYGT